MFFILNFRNFMYYYLSFSSEKYHLYHMVTPSPWPILTAGCAFSVAVGATLFMHCYLYGFEFLCYGLLSLIYCMFLWWRDVIRESTFEGRHTMVVQQGLRLGFLLFILSEVMFFFAFFWAFFHSSLSPAIQLGCIWPPVGIVPFNPWGVPLLNTYILLLSGATITATHHYMIKGDGLFARGFIIYTLCLALFFTGVQISEYRESTFSINDGVYGSTFLWQQVFMGFMLLLVHYL